MGSEVEQNVDHGGQGTQWIRKPLKNVVSAYITRWVMLLGFVFVLIVLYMPEGLVPGVERLRRRTVRRGAEA